MSIKCLKCPRKTNDKSCLCTFCRKTPIPRSRIRIKPKSEEKIKEDKENSQKMNTFWVFVAENTQGFSEISNKKIEQYNKGTMHHCYPKSLYPELRYSVSSILRCTLDEHYTLDNYDLEHFQEAKNKRKWIKDNWDYCILESKRWEKEYELNKLTYEAK